MDAKNENSLGPGMELIRGGVEDDVSINGCFCSPGGYSAGKTSSCGCACLCAGPSSPANNRSANDDRGDSCIW